MGRHLDRRTKPVQNSRCAYRLRPATSFPGTGSDRFRSAVTGSAEGPTGVQAGSAETPVERGSYLVNTIGACGNCHGRDASGNLYPDNTLAGGFVFDEIEPDWDM